MNNLENASGNLKEILIAIADGKEVQFWSDSYREWQTLHNVAFGFAIDEDGMKLEWRIKPDAFGAWWQDFEPTHSQLLSYKEMAKVAWDAAMEHKGE